jgi:hypothetical protein
MEEWASAIYALGGAVVGALGAVIAQLVTAKHTERTESARWERERAKEEEQRICEFRKERAKPILEALDRASAVYSVSWGDIDLLTDEIGYHGETIKPGHKEAYEKERASILQERLNKAVEDISTVARIPDAEVRNILYRALWKGITRPEMQKEEHLREIDEAYCKLEAWIFKMANREHGL